jgi:hypothetical protein
LHGLGTGRKKDKDFVNEILHSVDARFLSTVLYMLTAVGSVRQEMKNMFKKGGGRSSSNDVLMQ